MTQYSYNDIFEAYYFDELSSEDKAIFEKRLKTDDAWAADYETYRQIMIAALDEQLDNTPEAKAANPEEEANIFAYLNGQLSKAMQQQVTDREKKDPIYARKIAEMKAIKAAFEISQEAGTLPPKVKRSIVSKFSFEKKSGSTITDNGDRKVPIRSLWRWSIAASVLLLVSLGLWLFNPRVNLAERAWKLTYITDDPNLSSNLQDAYIDPNREEVAMSATDSILRSSLYQEAILAMINQAPETAEEKLQVLLKQYPNNPAVEYRLVDAILRQKVLNPEKVNYAIKTMEKMEKSSPNNPYVKYLLALAYASDDTQKSKSIVLLGQLLATNHPAFNNMDNVRKLLVDLQN